MNKLFYSSINKCVIGFWNPVCRPHFGHAVRRLRLHPHPDQQAGADQLKNQVDGSTAATIQQ